MQYSNRGEHEGGYNGQEGDQNAQQEGERAQEDVPLSVLEYDTQICGKLGTRMYEMVRMYARC